MVPSVQMESQLARACSSAVAVGQRWEAEMEARLAKGGRARHWTRALPVPSGMAVLVHGAPRTRSRCVCRLCDAGIGTIG